MSEIHLTDLEIKWDDEFVSLPNFHEVRDLAFLIRDPESDSNKVKHFMVQHRIPINSYLPVIRGTSVIPGRYLPLYHHLCQDSRYSELFQKLVERGCRTGDNVEVKIEPSKHTNLLYTCDSCYLKLLIKLGHHVGKDTLLDDIKKRFRMGQSERVIQLFQLGEIPENMIECVLRDDFFISDVLNVLVDRIYHLCEKDETNDRQLIIDLIHQYQKVVRFALKNGADPNQTTQSGQTVLQYAVDYYLVEIVSELLDYHANSKRISLVFHKDKNQTLTAIMRQLYNDKRYDNLCNLFKIENTHI